MISARRSADRTCDSNSGGRVFVRRRRRGAGSASGASGAATPASPAAVTSSSAPESRRTCSSSGRRVRDRERHGDAAGFPDAEQRHQKLDGRAARRSPRAPPRDLWRRRAERVARRQAASSSSSYEIVRAPSTINARRVPSGAGAGPRRGGESPSPRHGRRRDLEDQIELDGHDEPGAVLELLVELARSPARVAGQHVRAFRERLRGQDAPQEQRRRRQIQAGADTARVHALGRFGGENPAALRLDRPADEQRQVVRVVDRRIEQDRRRRRDLRRPVHDQAERALRRRARRAARRSARSWDR